MPLFAILRFALAFLRVLFIGYCVRCIAHAIVHAAVQMQKRKKKHQRRIMWSGCGKVRVIG